MRGPNRRRRQKPITEYDPARITCQRCRWPYPDDGLYSSQMVSSGFGVQGIVREEMCAICALDVTNEIHGERRERFHGEQAEFMRLNCIEWREQHPELKP